ncbi:MAG: cytochrome c oxidase subunit II [Actinomycetota bacterium]|nr:cytochrome c oxidase subunit II [Actinomycetota bacterium]
MGRRRWARGGSLALLLGTLVLTLSGCSVKDVESHLRFGWPTGVTKQAERMRVLWSWSGVAALALGVIVWGLIFWACIRYRKKNDRLPRQTKYNLTIESICVTVPFLVIVVLFWRTVVVEDYVNRLSKNPDVLVQVDAFKWNWQFEYQSYRDASGRATAAVYAGQTNQISGTGAPLHLSTVGSSTEIPVLVLPVGESVQVIEHSEDVVHSFWVPEFLFKRDVIPYGTAQQQKQSGLRDNRFQFTATSTGSFVGRCAELCGTYHSQMNFEVRVVSPQVFTSYLAALNKIGPDDPARQSRALQAAGMTPYATTTYPFNTDRAARSASEKSGG